MNLISENQLLYDIVETFEDIALAKWENYLKRAVRDAVRIIGLSHNYHLQSQEIDIEDDASIFLPDNLQELWDVLLLTNTDQAVEPSFAPNSPISSVSSEFLRILYRRSDASNHPVMRYDPSAQCLFIENVERGAFGFKSAMITYLGPIEDEYGNLMVPDQASTAVKAYMEYKVLKRLRTRDRGKITAADVESAYREWYQMAGHARGRLSKTIRPRQKELRREMWYRNVLLTPNRKLGA